MVLLLRESVLILHGGPFWSHHKGLLGTMLNSRAVCVGGEVGWDG